MTFVTSCGIMLSTMDTTYNNYWGGEVARQPEPRSSYYDYITKGGPNILTGNAGRVPVDSNAFHQNYYNWYFPNGMKPNNFSTMDNLPNPETNERTYGAYDPQVDTVFMSKAPYDSYDAYMYNPPVIYGHEMAHRNTYKNNYGEVTSINDKYFPTMKDKQEAIKLMSDWIGDPWYKDTKSYSEDNIHQRLDELRARMWAYDMYMPYGSNIYTKDVPEVSNGKIQNVKEPLPPKYIEWFLESSRPHWQGTK